MDNIELKIKQIVVDKIGISGDKIKPEAHFMTDLGLDSLDTVELVMELEKEFDIQIEDSAAEKLQTVKDAVEYIKTKVEKK